VWKGASKKDYGARNSEQKIKGKEAKSRTLQVGKDYNRAAREQETTSKCPLT